MQNYCFNFDIGNGNINSFLIGSKPIFESIEKIINIIGKSLDIGSNFSYKLLELENNSISYHGDLEILYPIQNGFGTKISKETIDAWFSKALSIILNNTDPEIIFEDLGKLGRELELQNNIIFVKINEAILKKHLEELEKLSIFLLVKLSFYEK